MYIHRDSQKRFYDEFNTYFITTNTRDRFPFFKEEIFCKLFVENLRICKKLKNFALFGFTILYDHVHLLIEPRGKFNISEIIHNLKRVTSLQINQVMNLHKNIPPNEGEDIFTPSDDPGYPRLQDNLQGNRYSTLKVSDFIINLNKKFVNKYGPVQHLFPFFRWQQSFYDHVIRDEKDFSFHLNYIFYNCFKHGIYNNPEKYLWSSANPELWDFVDEVWE